MDFHGQIPIPSGAAAAAPRNSSERASLAGEKGPEKGLTLRLLHGQSGVMQPDKVRVTTHEIFGSAKVRMR